MESVSQQAYLGWGLIKIMILWLILNLFPQADAVICTAPVEARVNKILTPCSGFLRGTSRFPSPPCCTGVKNLNAQYRTTEARQTACACLKSSFQRHQPDFRFSFAQRLPGLCNVNIGYNITTPNLDCSRIK